MSIGSVSFGQSPPPRTELDPCPLIRLEDEWDSRLTAPPLLQQRVRMSGRNGLCLMTCRRGSPNRESARPPAAEDGHRGSIPLHHCNAISVDERGGTRTENDIQPPIVAKGTFTPFAVIWRAAVPGSTCRSMT